jgi:hypothetical protein
MPAIRVVVGQRSRLLAPGFGSLPVDGRIPRIGQILDSCGMSCELGNLKLVVAVGR